MQYRINFIFMLKLYFIFLVLLSFFISGTIGAQQLSLSKAISDAMDHNLDIQQQQKRVMQADAYNQSSVGWFLPKVSVMGATHGLVRIWKSI